ncbi:MAG: murein transglycosylase domain-containing protein [Thermodesulfobacteriota bacterium]
MKKILFCNIVIIFFLSEFGYADFDEFKKQHISEFKTYQADAVKDFKNYQKELKESFNEYKRKVSRVWGKDNTVIPDKKKYVAYFDHLNKRSIIDYEKGKVTVEVITDKNETKNLLKNAVYKTLTQPPDTRSVLEIAKDPKADFSSKKSPLLEGQVAGLKKEEAKKNAEVFAEDILKRKKYKSVKVKDEKNQKTVVSVEFPLASDHNEKRARKYLDQVLIQSRSRNIDHKLIFAVIETESSFNPYARSPIPAFGLMQLVPSTAGRDSYRLVFKKDMAPTDKFLYIPDNNIELGSAYLYILFNRYLDEVEDFESRKWCVIAAYNTGIGNIFKTFAGNYAKEKYSTRQKWKLKAFEIINSMKSEDVYGFLIENLPYKETRNYLAKVKKRMPGYVIERMYAPGR